MTVVKNSNTDNHEIIWWSYKKVRWANDTVDYISIRHLHDDVVTDLPVGTRKRQGEKAFDEGNTGQSQGNHSHLCVARGHTKSIKVHESGYRDLVGSVMPNEVFFVNDTIIKNARGLVWKVYAPSYAKMQEVIGKQYCTLNNKVKIRRLPSTSYEQVGMLPLNTVVDITQMSVDFKDSYKWVKLDYNGIVGYSAIVENTEIIDKPTPNENSVVEPEIVIPVIVEPEKPQIEPIPDLEPVEEPKPIEQVNTPEVIIEPVKPVNKSWLVLFIEFIIRLLKSL
jgi:hypothetical protein